MMASFAGMGLALAAGFAGPAESNATRGAQDDSGLASELLEGRLGEIEEATQHADWLRAREQIVQTANEFARSPLGLRERQRLVWMLRRVAYRAAHEPPGVADVLRGRVSRYRERDASFRVHYSLADRARFAPGWDYGLELAPDLDSSHEPAWLVAPAWYLEDLDVLLSGEYFPPERGGLCVAANGTRAVWIDLGPDGATVEIRKGLQMESVLARTDRTPLEIGQPYEIEVAVRDRKLTVKLNGQRQLSVESPQLEQGRVAIGRALEYAQLELAGKLREDWVQIRLSRLDEEQRQAFEREFDPDDYLPRQLHRKRMKSFRVRSISWPLAEQPGEPSAGRTELLERLQEHFEADQLEAGLRLLAASEVGADFRSWCAGYLHLAQGDYPRALAAWGALVAGGVDLGAGRPWYALMLVRQQRHDEARAFLLEVLREPGSAGWPLAMLAELALVRGRHAEAWSWIDTAIERRCYGREIDDVSEALVKAREGPLWDAPVAVETEHYRVVSNIDRKTCLEAAQILEKGLERFSGAMLPLDASVRDAGADGRFRVYLFATHEGYQQYVSDTQGSRQEGTAGLYYPALRQLLVWKTPSREDMLRTIRHEGFHQYFDLIAEDRPSWFDEGLAEYWEGADFTKSASRMIPDQPAIWDLLRGRTTTLAELFALDGVAFYEQSPWTYAHAWAAIYFLLHSSRENRALFQSVFEHIADGQTARQAVDQAFLKISTQALEQEFRAFMAEH